MLKFKVWKIRSERGSKSKYKYKYKVSVALSVSLYGVTVWEKCDTSKSSLPWSPVISHPQVILTAAVVQGNTETALSQEGPYLCPSDEPQFPHL